MRYENYHKHDCYGNPFTMDTPVMPEEYCKRAVELGHKSVFTVNHGFQGNIFEWMELSKKYGLQMRYGTETYFVKDRFEKDRSNKHLIIIAKNNDGVYQLNDILSEAFLTGFYYKPRIDTDLLMSLNPSNFIITTACIGGIWDDTELIMLLHRRFGNNFFLELQNHNLNKQKEVNSRIIDIHKQTGIQLIHANDSHYIYQNDFEWRDIFLKGKRNNNSKKDSDVMYDDEKDMILDYPDVETILSRYEVQGIVDNQTVMAALENTLCFDECEPITIINDDIKLPQIVDNPTSELRKIINYEWKRERDSIPKEKHSEYLEAIRYEMDIVEKTKMENYFLIDYKVVQDGQNKYGGRVTNTGRGSAPSFYITKLLGLTNIDRLASPITLFPTRFMSVERIINARSLPDIDLNTTDRRPFIKATEDLLGKENCAWMISWKPLQDSNAFRLYCKGIGMHISEYDEVAKNLEKYENDKKWKELIEKSKRFVGVIEGIAESPCSMCLYDKPLRKELGLVRTKNGAICCLLDGYNCDKYKYLKNDYLTVTVWAIIKDVCELAGIPIPTINELNELLDDDTFDIYKNGLTSTINQVDGEWATELSKIYKPKSVAEMSAFVAIIRPGCASLRPGFLNREPYTTGVQELDNLLVEGMHRLIYQELIMKYLIWLGVEESVSYDIIKKISKKKFKEKELEELKASLLNGWKQVVGKEDGFIETWTVVEQAAKYSFNASHSLSYAYDSIYGAYLKSHYPLEYYTITLDCYSDDSDRTANLTNELSYWGIRLKEPKFRYSKSSYYMDKDSNTIYKGTSSVKEVSALTGDVLYEYRDKKYDNFVSLLYDLSNRKESVGWRNIEILIKLNYFEEFGEANKLLTVFHTFKEIGNAIVLFKEKSDALGINENLIRKHFRETEKQFRDGDVKKLLYEYEDSVNVKPMSVGDIANAQREYLGYILVKDERYSGLAVAIEVDTKYAPRLKMYSLKNGTTIECKISKQIYNRSKIKEGDIVRMKHLVNKPKQIRQEDGTYKDDPSVKVLWITDYEKVVI